MSAERGETSFLDLNCRLVVLSQEGDLFQESGDLLLRICMGVL